MRLNRIEFARFAPSAIPNTVEALEVAIGAYPDLSASNVLDDWLGQMWVESQGFSKMVESLNYTPDALISTFGKSRISQDDANKYGRTAAHPANQPAIANIVYGGDWGKKNLGNTAPGDGWKYRGSGFKQITGRANIDASGYTPEELRNDVYKSSLAAAHFFVSHGCVAPAMADNIEAVTKIINGGTLGIESRIAKTISARKVIL